MGLDRKRSNPVRNDITDTIAEPLTRSAVTGKRVGVTIFGGNIGLDGFCQIINQRNG
jgi:UDP-N-acetylglucosamine:LPS N-acetylglucosamine transferase